MTTTLNVVSSKSLKEDDRSAEAAAATELVRLAKEQGRALTGPDGLLKLFTKNVLETALNEELTEHLGHEKNRAGPDREGGNVRNGRPLILIQRQRLPPRSPGLPEQVGHRRPRHQIAMQHRPTRFLILVRCRTRCARAVVIRRSIAVRSSGSQTGGRKSAASSCARIRASTLSVFTFASAIARVFNGFDTTTRPACYDNNVAIASLFARRLLRDLIVDGERPRPLSERFRRAVHPTGIDPVALVDDGDLREVSMHVQTDGSRHDLPLPVPFEAGKGWANRHLRIRAHGAAGRVVRAAIYKHGLSAHRTERPDHTGFPGVLVPDGLRVEPDRRSSQPDEQREAPTTFVSGTNAIESLNARYRRAVRARGHFRPSRRR